VFHLYPGNVARAASYSPVDLRSVAWLA
jgi:hypothetical protein